MTVPALISRPDPADRRNRLVSLVAARHPGLAVFTDSEPCTELGGPWESAVWDRGVKRLKCVCFPAGTVIERSVLAIAVGQEFRRAALDPIDRLLAGIDWLLEGGDPWRPSTGPS